MERRPRLGQRLWAGAALAVAALCAVVVWAALQPRSSGHFVRGYSRAYGLAGLTYSDWRAAAKNTTGSTCVLHGAFGPGWPPIGDVAGPTKLHYARKYGYRLFVVENTNYTELLRGRFAPCLNGASLSGRDQQTVIKFCTLWLAFNDGCTAALWTDADAVIQPRHESLDLWLSNPADVVWSSAGHRVYCQPHGKGSETLGELARFGSCLNSGAFLVKRNAWSWNWVRRVLDLANSTVAKKCSTRRLNPDHFDQCLYNKIQKNQKYVGDQCVIVCEAMRNNASLQHFALDRPDDARPMQIAAFAHDLDRHIFKQPEQPLVVNCAAADNATHRLKCVNSIVRA